MPLMIGNPDGVPGIKSLEIGGQKLSVGYRILRGSTVDSERCRVLDERYYPEMVH